MTKAWLGPQSRGSSAAQVDPVGIKEGATVAPMSQDVKLIVAGVLDVAASALGFALSDADQNVMAIFVASVVVSVGLLMLGRRWRSALHVFIVLALIGAVTQFIPPVQPLRLLVAGACLCSAWFVWTYLQEQRTEVVAP